MSTQSTGPRSEEGKERSSLNATRHGLCSIAFRTEGAAQVSPGQARGASAALG